MALPHPSSVPFNMSSKSDECGCCNVISPRMADTLSITSIASQATQTYAVDHSSPAISPLLEQNNVTRAEILGLENLLCEKYAEMMALQAEPRPGGATNNATNLSYYSKLQRAVSVIDDLERLSQEDGLNEDAVDEYIRYLEHMYTQIPIVGPDAVRMICYSPVERARQYLQSRQILDSVKALFVVKDGERYSLIRYVAPDATFYHYDVIGERSETAQQLMFTLMQCLNVTRFVDMDEDSVYTDSGLFCVDNVMKALLRGEEERTKTMTTIEEVDESQPQAPNPPHSQSQPQSPVQPPSTPVQQLMQMHSHPDYLKIIIMSRYIVTKLSQMEKVCSGDVRQSRPSSP